MINTILLLFAFFLIDLQKFFIYYDCRILCLLHTVYIFQFSICILTLLVMTFDVEGAFNCGVTKCLFSKVLALMDS